MRNVIYSAVFGMNTYYPEIKLDGWDKVIFTDNVTKINAHSSWTICRVQKPHDEDGRSNRFFKWLSHMILPEYDYVLYFDSKVIMRNDLNKLVKCLFEDNPNLMGLFFRHPHRNCIYDELQALSVPKQDSQQNIDRMRQLFKKHQFPKNLGLTENNIFIRYNKNEEFNNVFDEIYYVVHKYTRRDQLVFMFCLWKHNMFDKITILEDKAKKYFCRYQHIHIP